MTCYMGVDYGAKRIGLAVGGASSEVASPLTTVEACGTAAARARGVAAIAADYAVDAFVVGLPLNMDGSEGKQARMTRAFGEELARVTGLPVHYHDERLSTLSAQELLTPAELTRKKRKARLDPVAAQIVLQDFLEKRGCQPGGDADGESQDIVP